MAVRGVDEEAYLLDKIAKPVGLLLWAATCRAGGRKVTCVVNLGKKKNLSTVYVWVYLPSSYA